MSGISQPTKIMPVALRVKEATVYIGCCRATLYRFVANGHLKPRKMGRATLFLVSDLDALLEKAAVPGAVKARVVGAVS